MTRALITITALLIQTTAFAECYERTYSAEHLKKYPNQEIRSILFNIKNQPDYSGADIITKSQGTVSISLIRDQKLMIVESDIKCEFKDTNIFYDPFVEIKDIAGKKVVCTGSDNKGTLEILRIDNPDFDVTLKASDSLKFKDATTNEVVKLKKGDNEFRLKMDRNIGDLSCEPVLFQPKKVTTARLWNDVLMQSIRYDLARPTVTSRNLFHFSALLWDVYASFDTNLKGYSNSKKVSLPKSVEISTARDTALHFAAYTFIKERYKKAPGNAKDNRPNLWELGAGDEKPDLLIDTVLNRVLNKLSLNNLEPSKDFDAAAYGKKMAEQFLKDHINDGSRESENYSPEPTYSLINNFGYLDVMQSGVHTPVTYKETEDYFLTIPGTEFADNYNINHWQPMYIPGSLDQNGTEVDSPQMPMTLFWGKLPTFSDLSDVKSGTKNGVYFENIANQIPTFENNQEEFIKSNLQVLIASQSLNPIDLTKEPTDLDGDGVVDANPGVDFNNDGVIDINLGAELIDISPRSLGNNKLGTNSGNGHALNPLTNSPYKQQWVRRADYYRSLAEFWADGPRSETPPGHWNVMASSVVDSMVAQKIPLRWKGKGPVLTREEYELKLYFTMNGALYDAGIVAWGLKGHYQGSRPVTVIRKLAKMAENDLAFGKKLESLSPYFKMVTFNMKTYPEGAFLDEEKAFYKKVTKLAVYAWRGPLYFGEIPNYRDTSFQTRDELALKEDLFYSFQSVAGVGWILAENWLPYQQQTFVTPPFPGYISGHSTFSRAAAEVLTQVTGSEYFPGGIGKYPAPKLVFEFDETKPFEFQWAKYYDASDESGISRIYGGIHAPFDDIPGRKIGAEVGVRAVKKAADLFE
jgi:hypothetical protein